MDKVKDTIISISETYGDNCLDDRMSGKLASQRRPQGQVHIYEDDDNGKRKLVHKSNLIVYTGREMLAQRLVDFDNANVQSTKDEWLQWFGVGDGGVLPADPLDPTPPIMTDRDLYSPVMISDTTNTLYANHQIAGDISPEGFTYPETGFYKKIFDQEPANILEFEPDSYNEDSYLIIKITTTIGVNDANGKQLSEAGLFSAASRDGGYNGNFTLFARVTYPTLIKTEGRRLIFVWYLYV